jgi:Protein of unknown function (DUF2442)
LRLVHEWAGLHRADILRLASDDGTVREVDLEDELWGPVFEPLRRDPQLFRQVSVDEELATIVWPNGADMDPDVLHGDAASALRKADG